MAENESIEGKDFAKQERKKAEFEQIIINAINNKEKGQAEIYLQNGFIQMQIRQEKNINKLNLLGEDIATINENGEFEYNIDGLKNVKKKLEESDRPIADYDELGLPDIEYLEYLEKESENEQNNKSSEVQNEQDDDEKGQNEQDDEKPQLDEPEEEKKGEISDRKNWQEMDLGREFTDEEDLREYIRATLKISVDRLYRVKTGPHQFKYMGEKDGEYIELDLTEQYEGTNTRQKVYIVQEGVEITLEEVDSLLLTKDGNHGIATKNADVGSTDVTKSFAVTRERGGKYVATQLIEKSGQNRDPRLPGKDLFDRGRGIEEVEDTIDSIEEMESKDLEIAEDEITVQEISLYEYFEMKGYREEEIDGMIKYMEEENKTVDEAEKRQENMRLTVSEIEEKLSKENPNAMPGQNRYLAQQIAKKMQESNYELTYEAAKEALINGKESEQSIDQKIPGENPRKVGH